MKNHRKSVNADRAHIQQYKNLRRKINSYSANTSNVVLADSTVILIRYLLVGLDEEAMFTRKKGGYTNRITRLQFAGCCPQEETSRSTQIDQLQRALRLMVGFITFIDNCNKLFTSA